jgi:uncharacterized protein DUF3224
MKRSANARFAIKSWDEKPYGEGEDRPRLVRASVAKTYTGDIEGEGQVEYVMMYRNDGSAAFVGLERVVGRIGDQVRQLRAPTHWGIRERAGEGVLFCYPRLRNGRPAGPPGGRQLRRGAWHGASLHPEL